MIRTIFVPLEISNSDEAVIKYAIELAKRFNARLAFLKTFLMADYAYASSGVGSIPTPNETLALEVRELKTEKLDYLNSHFPEIDAIDYELEVLSGAALDLIAKGVDDKNADLIIIGTSGATGVSELFGTIAEKLTREASCPVMVIPDEFEYRPFNKVSLALEVDNVEDNLHLDALSHIVKNYAATLDVVNVAESIDEVESRYKIISDRLKETFDRNVNYFTTRILLKDDEEKAITEYIDRNNIDLLTMIYRDHGFFKRLFNPGLRKKLVFHTDIPLLVLK